MSLINQMLKDLEHRARKGFNSEMALSGLKSANFNIQYDKYFPWFLLSGIIIFVACIFSFIHLHKMIHHQSLLQAHYISVASPPFIKEQPLIVDNEKAQDNTADLHAAATVVTGLTFQVQKEKTLLRLLLSQDAFYRVSQNNKQQVIITLSHAQIVSNLPAINTIDSAISDIHMQNTPTGDLMLVLTLKENAELNQLQLNTTGKYPELQIDMSIQNTNVGSALTSIAEVKTPPINIEQNSTMKKFMLNMSAPEEYQQALQYVAQGQSAKAITMLTQLIEEFPTYTAARETLAKLLLDQGKNIQADQIIKIGLQQHPYYAPYTELKARILVNEGQVNEAINLLQKMAPSLNTNPNYHAFIAALYQKQGQSLLAAKLYEQLLPLEPENSVWWMGLGIAYEELGKHNEALQAYARADTGDRLNPELKAYVESRMHSLQ